VTPLKEIVALAHRGGAKVMVDAAQGAPHLKLDVKALDCDFLAFTGHKVYGPDGIGVLYGKEMLLAQMPPWQTGGDMIRTVTFERTLFAEPPRRLRGRYAADRRRDRPRDRAGFHRRHRFRPDRRA